MEKFYELCLVSGGTIIGLAVYHVIFRMLFCKRLREKKKTCIDFHDSVNEFISKQENVYDELIKLIQNNKNEIEKNLGRISELKDRFNAHGFVSDGGKEFSERNPR